MTTSDDDVTSASFGGSDTAGGMASPWGSGGLDRMGSVEAGLARVRGVERLVGAR